MLFFYKHIQTHPRTYTCMHALTHTQTHAHTCINKYKLTCKSMFRKGNAQLHSLTHTVEPRYKGPAYKENPLIRIF